MASREDVYVAFGRAAELAQLFETEVGTSLLAFDALETKSYRDPKADVYLRLKEAVDGQTLGAALKSMTKYIELPLGTVELFAKTLEDRNFLIHRFFRESGFSMVEDAGRAKMVSHLQALAAQLERAYAVASHLSEVLVSAVLVLNKVHAKPVEP